MLKKILFIVITGATIVSCTKKETNTTTNTNSTDTIINATDTLVVDGHNAQNSLDWAASYEGTLPCADCTGIKTVVTLKNDNTFEYKASYIDKSTEIVDKGEIMWHNNGSVVHLKGAEINDKFKVIENAIILLDQEGNDIDGPLKDHYILNKVK